MSTTTWNKSKFADYGRGIKNFFHKHSRLLSAAFFCLVGYFVYNALRETDWNEVFNTFRSTSLLTILYASIVSFLCYSAYAAYDLISAKIVNKKLPAFRAWLSTWVCYSANLNLGAIIGSIALRYRLYAKLGCDSKTTSKIIAVTVSSNWIGYSALLSTVVLISPDSVSKMLSIPPSILTTAAVVTLGIVIALVCSSWITVPEKFKKNFLGKHFSSIGDEKVHRLFFIALVHWTLMATAMYISFGRDIQFLTIYTALLISCVAGAVSHVPGGLGVIEAVFLTMLRGQAPDHEIIASLVAYRIVYYFMPLLFSLPSYFYLEKRSSLPEEKV